MVKMVCITDHNEDRFAHVEQRLIEQNDVLNLPKGQAFGLLEGGRLYKLRMPLPKETHRDVPKKVEALLALINSK